MYLTREYVIVYNTNKMLISFDRVYLKVNVKCIFIIQCSAYVYFYIRNEMDTGPQEH